MNEKVLETVLQQTCRLKYSVTGYDGLDKDLAQAITTIKSVFEKQNEAISFISFADTELKENKVYQWIVDPDEGRFFYADIASGNHDRRAADPTIINDYYYFKAVLALTAGNLLGTDEERALLKIPKSAQLAYVLEDSFIYRIQSCNIDDVEINYYKEEKILVIRIPSKWFDWNDSNKKHNLKYTPIIYNEQDRLYEIEDSNCDISRIGQYHSNKADIEHLTTAIKKLSTLLRDKMVPLKTISDDSPDIYAEGFARLVVSLAYLSRLLNCCVESIPSVVAYIGGKPRCLGVFIWGYYNDNCDNRLTSPYSIVFQQFAEKLCACYANKYIKPLANAIQVRKEAIKSAVAALMARNLSHNLGSHDLTNTKNYFRNSVDKITSLRNVEKSHKEIITADYRGNAHLLQYVQERMDFIATIIAGGQYPLGGVNFKAEFFDILTNDDCGNRHNKPEKNFLLQYLLYSEKLTRHNYLENDFIAANMDEVRLVVRYDNKKYTGSEKQFDENDIKLKLSKLRLAVPGGIMARHALFTITENILRNSAKHSKRPKNTNLELTIKIEEEKDSYKLFFYDNCNSANAKMNSVNRGDDESIDGQHVEKEKTVIESIRAKLNNITIIGEDAKIDKNDKGLKEMLFCAIWLKNKDLSETLFSIQNRESGTQVSNFLNVKKVDDNGVEVLDEKTDGNLCYTFELDKWQEVANLDTIENDEGRILEVKDETEEDANGETRIICNARIKRNDLLKIHADFVVAKQDYIIKLKEDCDTHSVGKKLSEIFPSFILSKSENPHESVVEKQNTFFENYNLVIKYPSDAFIPPDGVFNYNVFMEWNANGKKNLIFYDHLLNEGNQGIWSTREFDEAEYFDSISGENFTQTITQPDFLKDTSLRYKVIRAAKAKIAIVDERIWENYIKLNQRLERYEEKKKRFEALLEGENWEKSIFSKLCEIDFDKGRAAELNVNEFWESWLSYSSELKKEKLRSIWDRLSASDPSEYDKTVIMMKKKNISIFTLEDGRLIDIENKECDPTQVGRFDFVSIHLGLLDKGNINNIKEEIFERFFGKEPFISIHSGRGNFSPDLEDKLKDYPFISLSALESALNNSKYLLSEFLYNTNYYGKGNFNYE